MRSVPAWPSLSSNGTRFSLCAEPTATAPGTVWLSTEGLGEQPLRAELVDTANARRALGALALRISAAHTGPCVTHVLGRDGASALRVHAEAPGPVAAGVLDNTAGTARVELRTESAGR